MAGPEARSTGAGRRSSRPTRSACRRAGIRRVGCGPPRYGVAVCPVEVDFTGQADRIHEAVSPHRDLTDGLIRVSRPDREGRGGKGA